MKEQIDLVSLPKKSFWNLSIPIIAFCIFDAVYGIVDMVWVSQISVEAFFAMGVSVPITTLIFSFGDSLGQGTNSLMSRFIGAGDYESSYNTLIHGIILANMLWVGVAVCILFANGILLYLEPSYILVFDYLIPIGIFAYVFIFINMFSETLQAEGNSKTPTILIIGSNILNIILDPIFIFNFNLGIKGAAYATVLSSIIVFSIILYLYSHGKTKIPLDLKYFKFRKYILVEIFKVALPNFLDNAIWCITASFINSTLIMTMGAIGPILFSVSNKIKSLLIAPIKGYSRGLMSVIGHLFGAKKFDDLNEMYKYALKISLMTAAIVMIAFIFVRDYAFGLFSITGMETEVFWIAIGGIFIMLAEALSKTSSKMLDGFGMSMYSLAFEVFKVIFEIILIYILTSFITDGSSILIGIVVTYSVTSIGYYVFLKHVLNTFKDKYEEKQTVKTFNS